MEIMSKYGISVPRGELAYSADQAMEITQKLGGYLITCKFGGYLITCKFGD